DGSPNLWRSGRRGQPGSAADGAFDTRTGAGEWPFAPSGGRGNRMAGAAARKAQGQSRPGGGIGPCEDGRQSGGPGGGGPIWSRAGRPKARGGNYSGPDKQRGGAARAGGLFFSGSGSGQVAFGCRSAPIGA